MASSSDILGLIAGSSQMPLAVAQGAKDAGRRVHAAAIEGITDPELDRFVDEVQWLRWGDLPAFFAVLEQWRQADVREAIMAGKVEQRRIYDRERGDQIDAMLSGLDNAHTDQLLGAVANVLAGAGIELLPSTQYLQELIPAAGWELGRAPNAREWEDIHHGWRVAKALGAHDIGQTVVVKERAVVAVESMEGTDACVRRAGELAGPGCVVVKVAKPEQDLRFDVPVVGRETIATLQEAGATALAVEAGMTVVFDQEELRESAQDVAVVAVTGD